MGRTRFTLFSVKAPQSKLSLGAANGSVSLKGGTVALTRRAGKAIKKKLKLRRMPRGAFGAVSVDALVNTTSGPGSGPGGGGPGGGGPGGGGPPSTGPISDEPPLLARPADAKDVTGASISWHAKPSFVDYIWSGEGTTASGGAANGSTTSDCPGEPPGPSPDGYPYAFSFMWANGWYHPPTGTAAVYFNGTVNFSFAAHGIDLDAKNPEIEINGASSRAIFRFDGRRSTRPGNKRAVLVNLDTAAAPSSPEPNRIVYTRMRGTLPESGATNLFAGFYGAGEQFGCVSLDFTYAP
jgi:Htaa